MDVVHWLIDTVDVTTKTVAAAAAAAGSSIKHTSISAASLFIANPVVRYSLASQLIAQKTRKPS